MQMSAIELIVTRCHFPVAFFFKYYLFLLCSKRHNEIVAAYKIRIEKLTIVWLPPNVVKLPTYKKWFHLFICKSIEQNNRSCSINCSVSMNKTMRNWRGYEKKNNKIVRSALATNETEKLYKLNGCTPLELSARAQSPPSDMCHGFNRINYLAFLFRNYFVPLLMTE